MREWRHSRACPRRRSASGAHRARHGEGEDQQARKPGSDGAGTGADAGGGISALLLLGAALLFRAPFLGNPVIGSDEQFYILVGDRLLHGLLPYVDVWARKPVR